MIVALNQSIVVPRYAHTLTGFRRWAHSDEFPESGQFCFVGGAIEVDMSPEELETHNKVKGDVFGDTRAWVRREDLGEILADRAFLINEKADLATEPDMMVCLWESFERGLVRFAELVDGSERYIEVVGSPDLVAEVISNTSVNKDTVELFTAYFRAGVNEYWLIDARRGRLRFDVYRRGKARFIKVRTDDDGYLPSTVLQAKVRLTREKNRRGTFRYQLEIRPA